MKTHSVEAQDMTEPYVETFQTSEKSSGPW